MKKIFYYLLVLLVVTGVYACSKSDFNIQKPIENDGTKPGVVTNVKVQNNPGGAIITYSLPTDADLQYVLAEYNINSTTVRQAKTSRFSDTIRVDGFNKAGTYDVRLYAVDKSENRSEVVVAKVNPETPPYRSIRSTLTLKEDFGGVSITFANPGEAKIAAVIITKDENGELVPIETFYTGVKNGVFSARGYDPVPRVFGVYIKDRWNNNSDTLFKTVTPLFEAKLDKSKFKPYKLPDDQPAAYGWEMPNLWDGKLDGDGFHTLQGALPRPHRFTFDLGVVAKLSRFKILQRFGGYEYNHGNPRSWRMWGTATLPDASGSWDGWTKLMDCESFKPSGLPFGQTTNEDIAYAKGTDGLGEEFKFPSSAPAVRYIRMEILKNWGGTDFFHAIEITFWGDTQ
ncbi:DUF5000 domain-containing lipoprotein [Pedobacter sp.]|jgi:hypothetical protein|uniref:DUF5000 domain-containing lipoprotein n=1 Tax=Pedobacter sp. TaxID=1411316 RepID=UPI002C4FBDE6|nr:DUF5000 domain-containing lipoprotein [Pedobacter sp.]HWW42555.1 DUF5000 domain-containing lipoprotein [Pedobacter sp.]